MASNKLCLVMFPSGGDGAPTQAESRILLDYVVRPAIEKYHFEVKRADDPQGADAADRLVRLIQAAELCIFFLAGSAPEFYYLVGRRHETGKPFLHLVKRGALVPLHLDSVSAVVYDDLSSTESAFETIWAIQRYVDDFDRTGYTSASMSAIAAFTDRIEARLTALLEKSALLPSGLESQQDFLDVSPVEEADDLADELMERLGSDPIDPAEPAEPTRSNFVATFDFAADTFDAELINPASVAEASPNPPPPAEPQRRRETARLRDPEEKVLSPDELDFTQFAAGLGVDFGADLFGAVEDTSLSPIDRAAAAIDIGDFQRAASLLPEIEKEIGPSDDLLVVASAVSSAGIEQGLDLTTTLLMQHRAALSPQAILAGLSGVVNYYIGIGRPAEGLPRVQVIVRDVTLGSGSISDPDFQAAALDGFHRIAYSAGEYARAREILARMLQFAPNNVDYLLAASRTFDKLNAHDRAAELVSRYLSLPGGDTGEERLAHAVIVFSRARRNNEARNMLSRLSRTHPERARLILLEPAVREAVGQ